MALQFSETVRGAMLQALETAIGAAPVLEIRTGAAPASCASPAAGALLAALTLPADWQSAPVAGAAGLAGVWSGTAAAAGSAGHYRILSSGGTVCHLQGSITATGGGGDMTAASISIPLGAAVSISSHVLTAGNA